MNHALHDFQGLVIFVRLEEGTRQRKLHIHVETALFRLFDCITVQLGSLLKIGGIRGSSQLPVPVCDLPPNFDLYMREVHFRVVSGVRVRNGCSEHIPRFGKLPTSGEKTS